MLQSLPLAVSSAAIVSFREMLLIVFVVLSWFRVRSPLSMLVAIFKGNRASFTRAQRQEARLQALCILEAG